MRCEAELCLPRIALWLVVPRDVWSNALSVWLCRLARRVCWAQAALRATLPCRPLAAAGLPARLCSASAGVSPAEAASAEATAPAAMAAPASAQQRAYDEAAEE